MDREMLKSQSSPLWLHTSGAQLYLNALHRSACPPEQKKQNALPCRSLVRGLIAEPAPGRSHWLPTLGYTFFLHRPCEHVYAYLYICSRYVSREQFAFPRVGGKPEKRLSMSIRPTMQNLLTETWQLQFEIEELKKKIAEKNKQISKFKEETREIEKKRENECGEKPATGVRIRAEAHPGQEGHESHEDSFAASYMG